MSGEGADKLKTTVLPNGCKETAGLGPEVFE
jgi:hypothetical protein